MRCAYCALPHVRSGSRASDQQFNSNVNAPSRRVCFDVVGQTSRPSYKRTHKGCSFMRELPSKKGGEHEAAAVFSVGSGTGGSGGGSFLPARGGAAPLPTPTEQRKC